MLLALLTAIVPTFGLLAIGWLWRLLDPRSRGAVAALNRYAFVVALPALIFSSVFALHGGRAALARTDTAFLFGIIAAHAAVALLAFALRALTQRGDVRALAPTLLTFGSTAYFGIPYATYAFGAAGTGLAALGAVVLVVIALGFGLAAITAHVARKQRTATWHQIFELPFLWVVLAALFLPRIGVTTIPDPIAGAIAAVAGSAAPVALIALGAFARDLPLARVPWSWAIPLGVGKVVLPALASFIALSLLGVSGMPLAVGTALGAAPLAITAFTLADEYDIGQPLVAGTMAVSIATTLVVLTAITALWLGTNVFS